MGEGTFNIYIPRTHGDAFLFHILECNFVMSWDHDSKCWTKWKRHDTQSIPENKQHFICIILKDICI